MKANLLSLTKYIGVSIFSFLAPIQYAMFLVSLLVIVDTITGIMKAGKQDVKKISSKKAFAIVPKLIFYYLLIIVAHGVQIAEPQLPFVKFALIGIGWIEIKSIDENFRSLFGFSFIDKTLHAVKQVNQIKRHKENDEYNKEEKH